MESMVGVGAGGGAIRLEGQRNWNLWKFQVSVLLRGMDLYSVVDGSVEKPEKAEEWKKRDAKAQSQIVMRLCESTMVHILACQTAAEMWNKLHSVYEQKSSTSLHILQQRFFQFKFEEGSDMATFLAKLQELKTQMKQAGEEVSEKFMITKVLMSLPSTLNYFVSAWESVEPARQTYDELVARLLVEEERLKSRVSESESVALYAGQKPEKNNNKEVKCFKCGRAGHYISQCKSDKDTRKCFRCNKIGHLKSQCPSNSSMNILGERNNAFIASALTTDFVDLESSHGQNGRWLIDSGASEHMVSERTLLTNYRELSVSNRFVVVGDGRRLPVVGIGDVILKAFDGHSYIKTTLYGVLCVPELKMNLFSVVKITKKGYKVTLSDEKCFVYKDNDLRAVGVREGNHYVMDFIYEDSKGYRVLFENRKQVLVRRDVVFIQSECCKNKNTQKEKVETIILLNNSCDQGCGPADHGQEPGDEEQGPGDQGHGPGDQGHGPGDQGHGPGDQGQGPERPQEEEPEKQEEEEPEEDKPEEPEEEEPEELEEEEAERPEEEEMSTRSGRVMKMPTYLRYCDAMTSDETGQWKAAVREKNTWTLVSEVPKEKAIISTKKKKKSEENEIKYKLD